MPSPELQSAPVPAQAAVDGMAPGPKCMASLGFNASNTDATDTASLTTMAPPSHPPEKEHQPLAYFTTRKAVHGCAVAPQKQIQSPPLANNTELSAEKRPLEEDTDKVDRAPRRTAKRVKTGADDAKVDGSFFSLTELGIRSISGQNTCAASPALAQLRHNGFGAGTAAEGNEDASDEPTGRRNKKPPQKTFKNVSSSDIESRLPHMLQDDAPISDNDDGEAEGSSAPAKNLKSLGSNGGKTQPVIETRGGASTILHDDQRLDSGLSDSGTSSHSSAVNDNSSATTSITSQAEDPNDLSSELDDDNSSTTSVHSLGQFFRDVNGRRYHSYDDAWYW